MSTRTYSLAALVLLAACSRAAEPPPDPGSLIECALGGAGQFTRDCAIERGRAYGEIQLTVRHPDGGFRRFEVTGDGLGVETADGAERATIARREDVVEVAVGSDRYRFPVPVAGDDER